MYELENESDLQLSVVSIRIFNKKLNIFVWKRISLIFKKYSVLKIQILNYYICPETSTEYFFNVLLQNPMHMEHFETAHRIGSDGSMSASASAGPGIRFPAG